MVRTAHDQQRGYPLLGAQAGVLRSFADRLCVKTRTSDCAAGFIQVARLSVAKDLRHFANKKRKGLGVLVAPHQPDDRS
jgi:hypothetical protein